MERHTGRRTHGSARSTKAGAAAHPWRAASWLALLGLALAACATRELPARHAESSPLSEDAAVGAPLSVTRSLDDEPAEPADAGLSPDGAAPAAPDHAHHHHHSHGGDAHAQ
jgi:hypothetical protein